MKFFEVEKNGIILQFFLFSVIFKNSKFLRFFTIFRRTSKGFFFEKYPLETNVKHLFQIIERNIAISSPIDGFSGVLQSFFKNNFFFNFQQFYSKRREKRSFSNAPGKWVMRGGEERRES